MKVKKSIKVDIEAINIYVNVLYNKLVIHETCTFALLILYRKWRVLQLWQEQWFISSGGGGEKYLEITVQDLKRNIHK